MSKYWKLLPKVSDDLVEQLLHNRGINSEADKKIFFNPKLKDFSEEIDIPNIKQSQKRIMDAIKNQELIFVFGDYDVDGICASAILYHSLTAIGAKVLPYIPHREKEGYGLSKLGLDTAKARKAGLVITVDCGIVAYESANYAKELGLDLIITDHHQTTEKLPEALAIVHTTKMCGAAVAWCLVREIIDESLSEDLLQFVAIATVCDMIPLTNVNRFFVKRGLEVLNETRNIGLKALIMECGIKTGMLGTFEIGFMIGPRLNAIGRLEHAIEALRLLCTKDQAKARNLAQTLCRANDQRRQLTTDAIIEAKDLVALKKDEKILVLHSKNWSAGIIGLVAGKIAEEYGISTIAISEGETISKGSARSVNGLNIVETIRGCQDLLIDVGGHEGAAGFTIETKNITALKDKLLSADLSKLVVAEPSIVVDAEVPIKTVSKDLINQISQFEPFGLGNPQVILTSENVKVDEVRTVGEGKHLKLNIEGVPAIGFSIGDLKSLITPGQLIGVAYTPEIDRYNGYEKIQAKIKDIHLN